MDAAEGTLCAAEAARKRDRRFFFSVFYGNPQIALPVLMESLGNNTVHWNLGREPAGHEPHGCMGTQGKGHEA